MDGESGEKVEKMNWKVCDIDGRVTDTRLRRSETGVASQL